MNDREFDVIVFGATGFTGQLVAEVMLARAASQAGGVRWAMAGRNLDKLAAVRRQIGAPEDLPLTPPMPTPCWPWCAARGW
jgi:short subunit dehydrogenase-like uncharacterized protein